MVTYVNLGSLQSDTANSNGLADAAPGHVSAPTTSRGHLPTRPGTPAVDISGVAKSFGTVRALRGVDLSVMPGHVYGVLGPNGAGKTTLLRIVLGLVRPDEGSVTVLGHRPGRPEALRRIGALVESPAFVPYLTGRANLQVLARALGVSDAEVTRVLRVVELEDRADERFTGYSLGMGQRLGVAAALLGGPPLLILDEPTNGLDPEGVASMRTFIRRIGEEGTTVLLSSHLLSEVQQICDRVIVINNGRVIADDTVSALRTRTGATVLKVWASPLGPAGRVLSEIVARGTPDGEHRDRPPDVTRIDDHDEPYWRLETSPEKVPELVHGLVEAGVSVHEVRRERPSLEDVFFTLTREDPAPTPISGEDARP